MPREQFMPGRIITQAAAALLLCAGATLLSPNAMAEACHDYTTGPIPDCQPQTQGSVHYSGLETRGWAYYCTGDHPYSWNYADGYPWNFTKNNNCFSVTENEFYETSPNKFDATITNWCLKGEDLVITLSCSDVEPPGYTSSCTHQVGGPVSDPGCPQSSQHTYCSTSNPPVCIETFDETCGATKYDCTEDLLVTWCYKCD